MWSSWIKRGSQCCSWELVRVLANIFISFIGGGVLGLPFAFKKAGIIEGTLIMITVSYLSLEAMLLLIDCKYKCIPTLCANPTSVRVNKGKDYAPLNKSDDGSDDDNGKSSKSSSKSSSRSSSPPLVNIKAGVTYGDVAFCAFRGRWLVDICILVSQIGFCCAYLLFIWENVGSYYSNMTKAQFLVYLMPVCFFMTLIPDLSKLAYASLIAQCSNVFAFLVVIDFDLEHSHLLDFKLRTETNLSELPFFISIAVYCFEGAGMILSLEQSVPDHIRSSFKYYFVRTIAFVTLLYVVFGVCGYLSFGEATRDVITLNLDRSNKIFDISLIVKILLCCSLYLTYPLMMFPVTTILHKKIQFYTGLTASNSYVFYGLRLVLVTITGLAVRFIPNFHIVMEFIGATCCTTLAFTIPAVCHFRLFSDNLTRKQFIKDIGLIIVGITAFIVCTIRAFIDWSKKKEEHDFPLEHEAM